MIKKGNGKQMARLLGFGVVTAVLYWTLFHNETSVLNVTSQGKWACWVPVSIAFIFSITHGAFTGEFWNLLGVKAKKN